MSSKNKDVNSINNENREKALNTIAYIEKKYGKGAIMTFDKRASFKYEGIPTGSFGLNLILGGGGLPRGRIIEIFGGEGTAKTTIALQTVAQAQKQGLTCAYIDTEHALNLNYARNLGVNLEDLVFTQPDSAEVALSILADLTKSGAFAVIVLDSVASLVPESELKGDIGESPIGLRARLLGNALMQITSEIHKNNVSLILINQVRSKIGISFPGASTETTPGGMALRFLASVRMEIKRIGTLFKTVNGQKSVFGARTRIKVIKNKMACPFREVEFDVIYGKGISVAGEAVDLALKHKLIKQSGAWYNYNDQKLGQGRQTVIELLEKDENLSSELKKKLIEIYESDDSGFDNDYNSDEFKGLQDHPSEEDSNDNI